MDVSVIIINYNTKKLTRECVESVVSQTKGVSFEIIVVDNASSDGSKEDLADMPFENYTYVYNQKNIGFSRANNQGYRLARGELLFFMNSDMVFVNDVISFLARMIRKNEGIGIIGPKFLNPDGSLQVSSRNFPSLKFGLVKFFPFFKGFFYEEVKKYYQGNRDYSFSQDVDTVSAGGLMISRILFEKIGCFDEFSFMYAEDADICKKVRDAGYRVVFHPEAVLIHYGGQSSKLNSYKAVWSYYLAFYYLYKKYYFGSWAIFVKPLFVLRALAEVVFNFFRKDKRITWNKK